MEVGKVEWGTSWTMETWCGYQRGERIGLEKKKTKKQVGGHNPIEKIKVGPEEKKGRGPWTNSARAGEGFLLREGLGGRTDEAGGSRSYSQRKRGKRR